MRDPRSVSRESGAALKAEEELEQFHYAGAAALGIGVSLVLWAAFGPGWLAWLTWMVIGMLQLPDHVARPVQSICYGVGYLALLPLVGAIMLVPGGIFYTFSRTIVETFPRWLQMVTLFSWAALLAAIAALLYSAALRRELRAWLDAHAPEAIRDLAAERVPMVAAVALYVNFVFVAAGCFAALAFMLHEQSGGSLFLKGAHPDVNHGTLADFLLWHVLDAIPGLKVPETIKWAAPLSYERSGAGWLLLFFKVIVIIPVLSGIGHYLREEETASADGVTPEAGARRGSVSPSE
jgi:hypothetical protein